MEIEEEEGYDEMVEKVVKRLAENDLYIKLEKYKWKAREVGFLEVVIVQNIQKFLGLANYYWKLIKDFVSIARLLYYLVLFSKEQSEVGLYGEAGEDI